MKKFNRFLAVALASVSVFGTLAACGGEEEDGVVIDTTKTQLYLSNYDAGIGRTWIEGIGAEFEKAFAGYSFEEGRTGVQVIYNHNRLDYGTTLESRIAASQDNIFFTEALDYPSLVTKNLVYNVTDIFNAGAITGVDAAGNFTREETPIKNKINTEFLSYLNRGVTAEAYYGAPYYLAVKNFIFDKELWNEKGFYLAKDATPAEIIKTAIDNGTDLTAAKAQYQAEVNKIANNESSGFWVLVNAKGENSELGLTLGLSAGPDGQYGTYDDGLPATVDEFYFLMDTIADNNVYPIIYTGKNPGYADSSMNGAWQNYTGKENLSTYYTLNGTINDLVVLDANGKIVKNEDGTPKTESKTLNGGREDGYEVQRSLGKYYALKYAERIGTTDRWLAPDCDNTAISQISAQSKFLTSCLEGNKRIAMLSDGAWWQQESDQTFEMMGNSNPKYKKENRDLAMMMSPNLTVDKLIERTQNKTKNLIVAANDSFCVMNNNLKEGSPQLAAAKAFFSFMNSDAMLNKFSEITNMTRGLNYEIDDETYAKMSIYGKNIIDYIQQSEIMYPYSANELVIKNYGYLQNLTTAWNWHTKTAGGVEVYFPTSSLRNTANRQLGLNAESFFEGLYNYQKNTVWDRLI